MQFPHAVRRKRAPETHRSRHQTGSQAPTERAQGPATPRQASLAQAARDETDPLASEQWVKGPDLRSGPFLF